MLTPDSRDVRCTSTPCSEPAVIRLRDSGQYLCSTHCIRHVENLFSRTVEDQRMIAPGDRIAVALSGGKDSTALLLLLHAALPAWPGVTLIAVTVDEGIAGYRDETIGAAVELTVRLGVEHHIVSFASLFGGDLDVLLKGRESRSCTVCGILRRRALATAARQAGATRIAIGHNLDDEAQTVLMNLLRGDFPHLVQDAASGEPECFIPRIKPLAWLSEREIVTYLILTGNYRELPECPYTGFALRSEVRAMLTGLEFRHPGTMKNLIRSRDTIRQHTPRASGVGSVQRCRECGEHCSGEICQVCRILGRPG
ncbi:MAG: TIGR00269 family protein [Methanomicrobiales archaeon]|nr:TIGR00269 family protein [Methanomicrobiales archaeon]